MLKLVGRMDLSLRLLDDDISDVGLSLLLFGCDDADVAALLLLFSPLKSYLKP